MEPKWDHRDPYDPYESKWKPSLKAQGQHTPRSARSETSQRIIDDMHAQLAQLQALCGARKRRRGLYLIL